MEHNMRTERPLLTKPYIAVGKSLAHAQFSIASQQALLVIQLIFKGIDQGIDSEYLTNISLCISRILLLITTCAKQLLQEFM